VNVATLRLIPGVRIAERISKAKRYVSYADFLAFVRYASRRTLSGRDPSHLRAKRRISYHCQLAELANQPSVTRYGSYMRHVCHGTGKIYHDFTAIHTL